MSLTGTHATNDSGHVGDHNLIDNALVANLGMPKGLGGAVAATRYVGGTTTGAPAAGTFAVGDFVITQDAHVLICTVAGSPGTWLDAATAGSAAALNLRATQQTLRASYYTYTTPASAVSASVTLGNGTFRCTPWWCPSNGTLTKIGLEVTLAGSTGAVMRLGIYNDDGTGYPGTLLLDAGTIDGTVVAVSELTISQAVTAGTLYWVGAAVQGAPTTQPTIRTTTAPPFPPVLRSGSSIPASNAAIYGYADFGQTGALTNFTTTVTGSSQAPRLFVKA
jgi:hypothetical protein